MLVAGCVYRHGAIVPERHWRIEFSPPHGPQINGVEVEQTAGELVVTGFGTQAGSKGGIEVEAARADGEVLGRAKATILPPFPVPKRGYDYRFRAVLPFVPPDGSVVRVIYRESISGSQDGTEPR